MIRFAEPPDRPHVEALLAAAGLPTEGVAEHFRSFLVVHEGGRVVGAAGLELRGEHALLRSVVVSEEARNAGHGSSLARRALDEARARGVRAVYLLTTNAEEFFVRLGFQRVVREAVPAAVQDSAEFRGACPSSAIAMRKSIGAVIDRAARDPAPRAD